MEIRQLRYFLAVADFGSISEAARRLGVSQPSVSDRIRTLEDRMRTNLFERQARGMHLTFAGRYLVPRARRIVRDVDRALGYAERVARVEVGSLPVGFYTSLSSGPLRGALRAFRSAAPDVALELHENNPPGLLGLLRDREIELAVTVLDVSIRGLQTERLWEEDLVVAVPIGHCLADKTHVTWADLEGELIVMRNWASGPAPYDLLPGRIAPNGYLATDAHFVSREALLGLVGMGFGLSVMGASAAGIRLPGVVLKPMSGPEASLPVFAVWLDENDNPARGRLVAMLRDWPANDD